MSSVSFSFEKRPPVENPLLKNTNTTGTSTPHRQRTAVLQPKSLNEQPQQQQLLPNDNKTSFLAPPRKSYDTQVFLQSTEPTTAASSSTALTTESSSSSDSGCWVLVYGLTHQKKSQEALVVHYFSQLGLSIVQKRSSCQGKNWMALQFSSTMEAQVAASCGTGKELEPGLFIGVKLLSSSNADLLLLLQQQQQPQSLWLPQASNNNNSTTPQTIFLTPSSSTSTANNNSSSTETTSVWESFARWLFSVQELE